MKSDDIESIQLRSEKKERCDCKAISHYVPREELRAIEYPKRINSIFVFPDSEAGINHSGEDAVQYATFLLNYGNGKLADNQKMNLPVGNATPVETIPWRYVLMKDESTESGEGVYSVVDNDLYYYLDKGKDRNNGDRTILKKHGKHQDKALNIFAMVNHPDSVVSPTYKAYNVGIALGTSLKLGGVKSHTPVENWQMAPLFNHEVGHILGLRHAWTRYDGCDDTPAHPNCWDHFDPRCKKGHSNNMMDYNNSQMALTPCQIGIATKNMHLLTHRSRKILLKDWCDYNPEESLIVYEDLHLDRHIDLKGDLIIKKGATLTISCRVHVPRGGSIIVEAGGKLILDGSYLHNDCGERWSGIKVYDGGIVEKQGEVLIENLD